MEPKRTGSRWDAEGYWFTRALFQRGLAFTYLIAFLNVLNQFKPLLGEHGLLPVRVYLRYATFREAPSVFFFTATDTAFTVAGAIGLLLSLLAISGVSERYSSWVSAAVWAALYLLYTSFVNVGQDFYAFGWESLLLEAGFYAIFLGSRNVAPQRVMIWLLRWLCFRIMFGAGLIKMRGDSCWHDLTCLDYHYETQPMPNPLSWFLHNAPVWTHRSGVVFNHFAELLAPFGYFLPQPVAAFAGIVTIVFQGSIMASGNLSWLNLLTMVLAVPLLDDRVLKVVCRWRIPELCASTLPHRILVGALAVLVAWVSMNPVRNMLSPQQVMNTDYNPLRLGGTYGAFGSITKTRYEVVVEGTDETIITPTTKWREYVFWGKPDDLFRMPPQVAPYHLRLDWLMWFAAMGNGREYPWFEPFLRKLLEGDKATLSLLRANPFEHPPRWVRAQLYEYHFTTPEERRRSGDWWKRTLVSPYWPEIGRQ